MSKTSDITTRVRRTLSTGIFESRLRRTYGLSSSVIRRVRHGEEACERCPGCNELVTMPCVLCEIRNAKVGPNSNVEVATNEDCRAAFKSAIRYAVSDEAVAGQRWTIETGLEVLKDQRRARLLTELDDISDMAKRRTHERGEQLAVNGMATV
jgi:hypothetical protein